jgi:transcriptional antiterminator RfaH
MSWFLVHCKPRQEKVALQNLERQGYQCYLPTLCTEKLRRGALSVVEEPLFPRYLFLRLGEQGTARGLAPVRSTKGVSRLVGFGVAPVRVEDALVAFLQKREAAARQAPERLFVPGDRVRLTDGAFAGIEGIYQMTDGEQRAVVLIEFLSKPVSLRVPPSDLRKTE